MVQSHVNVINLSYYYNKKQPRDAIVYILPPLFFVVAIILFVLSLFSRSAWKCLIFLDKLRFVRNVGFQLSWKTVKITREVWAGYWWQR